MMKIKLLLALLMFLVITAYSKNIITDSCVGLTELKNNVNNFKNTLSEDCFFKIIDSLESKNINFTNDEIILLYSNLIKISDGCFSERATSSLYAFFITHSKEVLEYIMNNKNNNIESIILLELNLNSNKNVDEFLLEIGKDWKAGRIFLKKFRKKYYLIYGH